MYANMAILALFILIYSAFAGRIERSWLTGPIIFTVFGLLAGPSGLGILLPERASREVMMVLAELALALVLFIDASKANMVVLKRNFWLPTRLLLIGLPLTIGLGIAGGLLIFDSVSVLEIAILATMLAPTDAALGKAVVSNPAVAVEVREGLNIESGLNDGICVPILLLLLAIAAGHVGDTGTFELALELVLEEIGIGIAVGAPLGGAGALLLGYSQQRGWLDDVWEHLPVATLALVCFAGAQTLGGSGFIGAYIGGIVFGLGARQRKHELLSSGEGIAELFAVVTWVYFGCVVVPIGFTHFSWEVLVYALLSLTVVRMLPVYVSTLGLGIDTVGKLFVGWFGPRGLASIVFAVIVAERALPGGQTLSVAVIWTVVLSILLHGLSASPLAAAFGASPHLRHRE